MKQNQRGITLVALVITVIILIILAGVGISMITGQDGLFARANYAANLYKGAQQNEAEAINAILNNQYLSGLLNFSLSATATDTSITVSGQTTGNGTVSYKYAILETAGNVDWDSITETTDISKTFTTLMDGSTALTKGTTYYVYMQAIDEEGQAQLAGNNGLAIKAVTPTNEAKANGSFDTVDLVNSPNVSLLNTANFSYITWVDSNGNNSNIAEPTVLTGTNEVPTTWHDYDTGQWANIKTYNGNIEAYWVWIPRFAYQVPTSNGTGNEDIINVKFINGIGTTLADGSGNAVYATDLVSSGLTKDLDTKYKKGGSGAKWIVHPAFTFGDNSSLSDSSNKQLSRNMGSKICSKQQFSK